MEKRICRIESGGGDMKGYAVVAFIGKQRSPRPLLWGRKFDDVRRGKGTRLGRSCGPLVGFVLIFLDSLGRRRPFYGSTFLLVQGNGLCYQGGDDTLGELLRTGSCGSATLPPAPRVCLAAA